MNHMKNRNSMNQTLQLHMRIPFLMMALLLTPVVGDEIPSIETILRSVQKQGAPDSSDLPDDVETDAKKIIQNKNAELLFHKRVMEKGDLKTRILHAITILNSSISYYDTSGAAARFEDDYAKMVNFRTRLADEFVRLTRLEKPSKAGE